METLIAFLQQHSSILAILAIVFVFSYPAVALLFHHSKPSELPPGTLGWFPHLLQNLSFLAPHPSNSRGYFLEHNIQRYGPIFKCHLYGHPAIVSCDGDFNSFILQQEDRLVEVSYPSNVQRVFGDLSLLVVTGDLHKRLRGTLLNFFAGVKAPNSPFLAHIEENAVQVMLSWATKKTIKFCEESRKFTFGVLAKAALSLGPEDAAFNEMFHNFKSFIKGLASLPINIPGTAYAKAIHARHRIKVIMESLIQQREGRGEAKWDELKMDFLDVLLAHGHLSKEEIVSVVMDLLVGGQETTTMFIATVVKFLSDHPRALEQLRREHERVGDGRQLQWDDYKQMSFTQDVMKEALRCGNLIKFVCRKSIKPIHYKGFKIPVGWKIIPVFSGVHLDPSRYSNPEEFNPYRWQGDETRGHNGFTPFAGGKRLCPGNEFAKLETAVFLHHLVLNFSWTPLKDTDCPMSVPYLDFEHGFPVAIKRISPSD
ncbi:hypothetical protein AAC387_Pa04g2161 [Persea americana]